MGEFQTFDKAAELLHPGNTFAEVSPSGARLILAELERLRAIEAAAEDWAMSAAREYEFLKPTAKALFSVIARTRV